VSGRRVLTLCNGRGLDLLNPTAGDYSDFVWQAEHLAKENRFNGATLGLTYSVAEHAARAADVAYQRTRDPLIAAAALLHDNPEAALKDDTTPKKHALAGLISERCGVLAPAILACFAELERRHEEAVHLAAGLPWPLPEVMCAEVKAVDKIMFVTEWRDLMGNRAHPDWTPYVGIEALPGRIRPRAWQSARLMWLERAVRFLPVFAGRQSESILDVFPQLRAASAVPA
jgi:uncharacterized protein